MTDDATADTPGPGPARAVARLVGLGGTSVLGLARLGRESLLAALLAALDGLRPREAGGADDAGSGASPGTRITSGLLAGDGRLTRVQVAEAAGVPLEQTRRLWSAVGFPSVDDEQRVFTSADVAALRDVHGLVLAGAVDLDGAVALARPMGQLLSRLAATHTALIGELLGARLAGQADAQEDADDPAVGERVTTQAVATTRELLPALERTTLYVWRRHLAAAAGRELVVAADPGTPEVPLAVCFVDISGYTRLSRSVDQLELATLLDLFETVVAEEVVAGGGRVVTTLGDEVLFVCATAEQAARVVLAVLDRVALGADGPAVHAGLAWGPVLTRSGDVYGPVVNVASRLTGLARRGTVLVDDAAAAQLAGCADLALVARSPRRVRGYARLPSYQLSRAEPPPDPAG